MISFTDAQLNAWLIGFIWPLTRILGLIMAAPVFGHRAFPARAKIALGVFLAIAVSPALPPLPAVGLESWQGLWILLREFLIGVSIGFSMRLAFAATEAAGEMIGLQMGLGFASFYDPVSSGESSVVSSLLNMLAILLFLSFNGHLFLLDALARSFQSLPVSAAPLAASGFWSLASFGSIVLSLGVRIALPIIALLLMVSLSLGILTRSAPQLNIFSIGFPITLGVGLLLLSFGMPYFSPQVQHLSHDALRAAESMLLSFRGISR